MIINVDGPDEPQTLTRDPSNNRYPDWTPDGKSIAYTSNSSGHDAIWVMSAEGIEQHMVPGDGESGEQPAWSPDGMRIAFIKVIGQ
jgi:Tol biopolymer transport system component